MRLTTIINAMIAARDRRFGVWQNKRNRQYQAFRAALIRRDEQQRFEIAKLRWFNEPKEDEAEATR